MFRLDLDSCIRHVSPLSLITASFFYSIPHAYNEPKFAVNRKRPIAYAIVTAGSAIGGVLYPIMFRRLEPSIGCVILWRVGGVILKSPHGQLSLDHADLCVLPIALLRIRYFGKSFTFAVAPKAFHQYYQVIKPRQAPPRDLPRLFDLRGVVTSPAYISYVFAVFLAFMALFTRRLANATIFYI